MSNFEQLARKAMQDFVDKCDNGTARSVRSYAAFKEALAVTAPKLTECRHCGFYVALNQAAATEPQAAPRKASELAKHWMGEHDVVLPERAYRALLKMLIRPAAPPSPQPVAERAAAADAVRQDEAQDALWLKDADLWSMWHQSQAEHPRSNEAVLREALDVAEFIEHKAESYLVHNADTEHDTGSTVFHYGEAGRDYHSNLVELAEEIRTLAATATVAKEGGEDDTDKVLAQIREALKPNPAIEALKAKYLATPKPEASAEQPAGEVEARYLLKHCLPVIRKHGVKSLVVEVHDYLAAPISKDNSHDLYTDSGKDRPDVVCDSNGQVVLGLCKKCGKGECELVEPCEVKKHGN